MRKSRSATGQMSYIHPALCRLKSGLGFTLCSLPELRLQYLSFFDLRHLRSVVLGKLFSSQPSDEVPEIWVPRGKSGQVTPSSHTWMLTYFPTAWVFSCPFQLHTTLGYWALPDLSNFPVVIGECWTVKPFCPSSKVTSHYESCHNGNMAWLLGWISLSSLHPSCFLAVLHSHLGGKTLLELLGVTL